MRVGGAGDDMDTVPGIYQRLAQVPDVDSLTTAVGGRPVPQQADPKWSQAMVVQTLWEIPSNASAHVISVTECRPEHASGNKHGAGTFVTTRLFNTFYYSQPYTMTKGINRGIVNGQNRYAVLNLVINHVSERNHASSPLGMLYK